jgi:hypothetical protein
MISEETAIRINSIDVDQILIKILVLFYSPILLTPLLPSSWPVQIATFVMIGLFLTTGWLINTLEADG